VVSWHLPLRYSGTVTDQFVGAQLALTAGLYLQPPPLAIVSLYPITDPTDDTFTMQTKPSPPPGRKSLITYDEVREYIGPDAPMVSHPEISSNIPEFRYWGRASAYFYMLQEGIYLESVYGTSDKAAIDQRWNIPSNLTEAFPPVFAAHAQQDRFVPHQESEKLVKALQEKGVEHVWWSVPGDHDHGFDALDIDAGEEGNFGKEFAAKLWPWLEKITRDY
jgi:acetyl esterase/lipase